MSSPALSILLPVRDEETHLPTALDSLFRQSFGDWELVAVDDGSRDATAQILADVARRDPRLRVLRQEPAGVAAPLERGLAACRAPLVARMDGDDVCHPERLGRQIALLRQRPEIDLVACGVRHFPRPQLREGMRAYEQWQNALQSHEQIVRDLYVESPFAHPSVMFRRGAVVAAGGYRDRGWAEDYDLWLRLARRGSRFARLPETLFFWRDRPERLTRTAASCSADAFRRCKLHHLRYGYLAGVDEVTLWGAGQEGKAWRRLLAEAGIRVVRWIDVDPRKIGQRIHGAPVAAIDELRPGAGKTLITVGTRGARAQVRAFAVPKGLAEGVDFLCVT